MNWAYSTNSEGEKCIQVDLVEKTEGKISPGRHT
jgi:hypothetical protein